VSLYNETQGRAILPTPTVGGVGLIQDFTKSATLAFKKPDELILLIGDFVGWLGQSLYLRDICGREEGASPPVDLELEKKSGDFVRALIKQQHVTAVHDISDGGLLVALAEMAMAGNIGAALDVQPNLLKPAIAAHAFWFGEEQARYIITADEAAVAGINAAASEAQVLLLHLSTTGGDALTLPGERPILISALRERFEGWLPKYMAGGPP